MYIEISASLFPLLYIEFWIWNELILINCSYFFAIVYYVSVIYVSDVIKTKYLIIFSIT